MVKGINRIKLARASIILFAVILFGGLSYVIFAGFHDSEKTETDAIEQLVLPDCVLEIELDQGQVIELNKTFEIDIVGSCTGEAVGVDSILRYNEEMFEVVEIDTGSGDFSQYPLSSYSEDTISVTGIMEPGKSVTGDFIVARITLETLKRGNTNITVDFTQFSTIDSNIVEKGSGKDLLKGVFDLNITVE